MTADESVPAAVIAEITAEIRHTEACKQGPPPAGRAPPAARACAVTNPAFDVPRATLARVRLRARGRGDRPVINLARAQQFTASPAGPDSASRETGSGRAGPIIQSSIIRPGPAGGPATGADSSSLPAGTVRRRPGEIRRIRVALPIGPVISRVCPAPRRRP